MPAHNFQSLTGLSFGRLLVLTRAQNTHDGRVQWQCFCVCGNVIVVRSEMLKRNRTTSCGCLHKEIFRRIITKHGKCHLPEYNHYAHMRSRCLNPNNKKFKNYGGRGITIAWTSFEEFFRDMGPRPSSAHSLERIDNNGPYSQENCRWAIPMEQANNKRNNHLVEYHGIVYTQAQLARHLDISYSRLKRLVKRNKLPA